MEAMDSEPDPPIEEGELSPAEVDIGTGSSVLARRPLNSQPKYGGGNTRNNAQINKEANDHEASDDQFYDALEGDNQENNGANAQVNNGVNSQQNNDKWQVNKVILFVSAVVLVITLVKVFVINDKNPMLSVEVHDLEKHEIQHKLNILVTGKSGTGKQTLIESLFNATVVSSGPCRKLDLEDNLINVLLCDSDSLDANKADLVLFALKMDDTRCRPDDREIVQKLAHLVSWHKVLTVLTYANKFSYLDDNQQMRRDKEKFTRKVEMWEKCIRDTLVSMEITEGIISLVPVGHPSKLQLFEGEESWQSQLAKCIVAKLSTSNIEAGAGMWKTLKSVISLEDTAELRCHH